MKPVDAIIGQNRAIRTLERGRLFRKYFLLILALVCGALLISGGIGIYFSYQENKIALSSLQREKAVAAAARIEQFIHQIEQQLAFAALPQLGAEGMEQRRIEFMKLQRLVPAITDTAQIDGSGRERLTHSRLGMDVVDSGIDRSQDPAFKGAKPKETWFGPVSFRKETEPYMSIAVRSSEGDLEQRIEAKTGDELEALAEQFNQMMVQLRESYAGLERKVDERTAELQETVAHQRASAGILGIIASSVEDTQPVFQAIAHAAATVLQNSRVQLFLLHDGNLHHVGSSGLSDEQRAKLAALFPAPLTKLSYTGASILEKKSFMSLMFSRTPIATNSPKPSKNRPERGLS